VIRASFGKIVAAAIGISLSPTCPDHGAAARAGQIKVLNANVLAGVLDELASGFQRASEHKVTIIGLMEVLMSALSAALRGSHARVVCPP
jgi:hypothetical protein